MAAREAERAALRGARGRPPARARREMHRMRAVFVERWTAGVLRNGEHPKRHDSPRLRFPLGALRCAVPPTAGAVPPTTGAVPPTTGAVPPTAGAVPPTAGAVPPTAGAVPPTTGVS